MAFLWLSYGFPMGTSSSEAQRLQQQCPGTSTGTCAAVATWRTYDVCFVGDLGKGRKPMKTFVYIYNTVVFLS